MNPEVIPLRFDVVIFFPELSDIIRTQKIYTDMGAL